VRHCFHKAGWNLTRQIPESFGELSVVPRYQAQTIQLDGKDFKISDAHSFRHSFIEIFENEIYRFPCEHDRPRIIDCGSNHGTSIVYFKTLFPKAVVHGIECDPEIFDLLSWNIESRNLTDITLTNKAISNSVEQIRFFQEGADAGRAVPLAGAVGEVTVDTISLDSLLDQPVDFLKMDIEGMETDVICGSQRLEQVACMFVEYHSFSDRPQDLSRLLGKLTEAGFRYFIQSQFCALRPLVDDDEYLGMDLQLNIFAKRNP